MKVVLNNSVPRNNSAYYNNIEPDQNYFLRTTKIVSIDYALQTNEFFASDLNSIQKAKFLFPDFKSYWNACAIFLGENGGFYYDEDIINDYLFIDAEGKPNEVMAVGMLMANGMSQQEATLTVLDSWQRYHKKVSESYNDRSFYIKKVVTLFLNISDAMHLLSVTKPLLKAFTEDGVIGHNYGVEDSITKLSYNDIVDGLMNFIDSSSVYTGNGLKEQGYTLLIGTYDDFISMLKDVIVYGNYKLI